MLSIVTMEQNCAFIRAFRTQQDLPISKHQQGLQALTPVALCSLLMIMRGRELIPHMGLISKLIPPKSCLDEFRCQNSKSDNLVNFTNMGSPSGFPYIFFLLQFFFLFFSRTPMLQLLFTLNTHLRIKLQYYLIGKMCVEPEK